MMRLRSGHGYSDSSSKQWEESERLGTDVCPVCSKRITDAEQAIKCKACSSWIHTRCIGQEDNQAEVTRQEDNQAEVTQDIYSRLSDRRYQFFCRHCNSEEAPTFWQSLYNTRIISREEVRDLDWEQYIDVELEEAEEDKRVCGQGDASTSVQSSTSAPPSSRREPIQLSQLQVPSQSFQSLVRLTENTLFL